MPSTSDADLTESFLLRLGIEKENRGREQFGSRVTLAVTSVSAAVQIWLERGGLKVLTM
jgi:hypothetical protein